jgi:hypothetical protein
VCWSLLAVALLAFSARTWARSILRRELIELVILLVSAGARSDLFLTMTAKLVGQCQFFAHVCLSVVSK